MGGWTNIVGLAALACVGLIAPASAAEPEKFKDWELFCPDPKPKDKPRICEVRTIITGKEGAKLGALAVAPMSEAVAPSEFMAATALLPLGVDLTEVPTMWVAGSKLPPLPLQFRRCLPRGCEAFTLIMADRVAAMRAGAIAKVAVRLGDGRKAVFEFSLAGFAAAHDAIKQRVAKP